jgi:hypothetical protein
VPSWKEVKIVTAPDILKFNLPPLAPFVVPEVLAPPPPKPPVRYAVPPSKDQLTAIELLSPLGIVGVAAFADPPVVVALLRENPPPLPAAVEEAPPAPLDPNEIVPIVVLPSVQSVLLIVVIPPPFDGY